MSVPRTWEKIGELLEPEVATSITSSTLTGSITKIIWAALRSMASRAVVVRRIACLGFVLTAGLLTPLWAQTKADGPTNEKAQKTYKNALDAVHQHRPEFALDDFKKADKQDGGHCLACQKLMVKYGIELGEWKTAELAAEEMVAEAQGERDTALAHYQFGTVLMNEGWQRHKDEFFARAHDEFTKALAAFANFPDAIFLDGRALAQLHQDDAAKARFGQFVKMNTTPDPNRQRALRYISRPELARARMAPAFTVTTLDGKLLSMDDLQGKVVLLDFWATWCGPCREALPHIRNVAKKFTGEPLVILSVSLDDDEQKWKEFIAKNEMTWPQYRDAGFGGPVAKLFDVHAIPHTFTIDADGVLQEEHIGDASIEGKLKKLLAQAREAKPSESAAK
jgi:thiol-disulfide isomerase/thioredoxin